MNPFDDTDQPSAAASATVFSSSSARSVRVAGLRRFAGAAGAAFLTACTPTSSGVGVPGSPESGAPPDASGGACVGALVCDDFESYASGAAPAGPWAVAATAGSVTVDRSRAYSGAQSVKVLAPASTGYRSVMLRLSSHGLPVAGNVVYGRMMFWLDSSPATMVHWTFIDGEGLVSTMAYHAVVRYGGQIPITGGDGGFLGNQLMASYDTPDSYNGVGPSSDCYQHSQSRVVPLQTWTCAEWEFDGPDNTMRFWMDGQALDDLTVNGTGQGCTQQPNGYVWTAPNFAQIDVGWESYQADDARNLWIDDVGIGTQRVGCPTPAGGSADGG
jgi:hypothetical protein